MPKYSYDPTVKTKLLESLTDGAEKNNLTRCFQVLDTFNDGCGHNLFQAFKNESLELKDLTNGSYQVDIGSYKRFMFKIIRPNTALSSMEIGHT